MKYQISINQKAIVDMGLADKVDIIDLSILDFITSFIYSPRSRKVLVKGEVYCWIKTGYIIDQLPLLGIKSLRPLYKRIEKLIQVGLLARYEEGAKLNQSLYKIGERYEAYLFDDIPHEPHDSIENDDNMTCDLIGTPVTEKSQPVTNQSHPCDYLVTPPVTEKSHVLYNIDNNINNYTPPTPQRGESTPTKKVPKATKKIFIPPTLEEVKQYCAERLLTMDAEHFYDYFQANGWLISGKTPMKDWRAAVRNWARNENKYNRYGNNIPNRDVNNDTESRLAAAATLAARHASGITGAF